MDVEDHPQFDACVAALNELKRAQDVYQSAVAFKVRSAWVEHARSWRRGRNKTLTA
jgi:hypothetical protein